MSDVTIEHVQHHCETPGILPLPDGASFVIARWRCPTCGQRWRIKSWKDSSVAEQYGLRLPSWTRRKWLREEKPSC